MNPQQALQILASVAGRPMSPGEDFAAREAVKALEAFIAEVPKSSTASATT